MKRNMLGKSGIEVTELCFGTLPMGEVQSNLPLADGIDLISEAIEQGINFFDGAQLYKNYGYLKGAMHKTGKKDIVISSKCVKKDYAGMEDAILEAMREMDRDYVDIFFLHAPQGDDKVFEDRAGAWQCLLDYKQKGYLRAIGLATHKPSGVVAAAKRDDVDIIFPLINKMGWGFTDGSTVEQMLAAIEQGRKADKGLYAMKVFAGGHLVRMMPEAIQFVRDIPGIQALAIGMVNKKELDVQLRIFNGGKLSEEEVAGFISTKNLKILDFICTGCGKCMSACGNDAMHIVNGKAQPVAENCVLCGYCVPACPNFAIRMR